MLDPKKIADALTTDRSKDSVLRILQSIEKEGLDFHQFFRYLPELSFPLRWYMTWVLTHYIERNKSIGNQNQEAIWTELKTNNHPSMQRDLWRSMTFIDVDDKFSGEVYDAAVKTLMSVSNPIAVRAHAMYCAANIAQPFPELSRELALILADFNQDDSAGLRARAKNLSRKLQLRL